MKKELLINKIKSTGCFKSNMELYGDRDKKICFLWSPRAGCSITFKCFLDMIGLLDDAEKYNDWIHNYRMEIMWPNISYISIQELKKNDYTIIKTIVNPYSRAVSIWRSQHQSHNLSFRDYLKELTNNKIDYFNENDKYHLRQQYVAEEEQIITKYIKLDKYEKYDILLTNGDIYTIDVTKYTSNHHAKRNNNNYFVGDIKLSEIHNILPNSYKYFYDDEIKEMVYKYYKKDIDFYSYTFDELI
jgi:hypothetical protein